MEMVNGFAEQHPILVGWIIAFLLFGAYFFPAMKASELHHRYKNAIFVLNFLLGWTVLGWVGALVWAYATPAPTPDAASPGPSMYDAFFAFILACACGAQVYVFVASPEPWDSWTVAGVVAASLGCVLFVSGLIRLQLEKWGLLTSKQ